MSATLHLLATIQDSPLVLCQQWHELFVQYQRHTYVFKFSSPRLAFVTFVNDEFKLSRIGSVFYTFLACVSSFVFIL